MDYKYIIAESGMVTPTTFSVTMYSQNPRHVMPYKPGQYATLSFQSHNRPSPMRCFSIVSTPLSDGWLQFAMRVEGDYTQSASKKIKPGDVVDIEGPFGGFVVNPYRDQSAVLLAGGIGITPFMSMIRTNTYGPAFSSMTLIYSCRNQDDVPFANELIEAARISPYLKIIFVISNGPINRFDRSGMIVLQGRLTPEMLDQVLGGGYHGRSFFLCGPPPFMDAMESGLLTRGVSRRRIMTEVFTQQVPQTAVLLGRPSQIYALTALSLLAGTGIVLNQDVKAVAAKAHKAELASKKTNTTDDRTRRQNAVSETIAELQANLDAKAQAQQEADAKAAAEAAAAAAAAKAEADAEAAAQAAAIAAATPSPVPSPSPRPTPKPSPSPTPPPATPPPAPPPVAPVLSLTASSRSIIAGGSTTLSWAVTNSATQPISCGASGGWSGSKSSQGSTTVRPSVTTTYSLSCSNKGGSTSKSVTITVTRPSPPPPPPPPPSSKGS